MEIYEIDWGKEGIDIFEEVEKYRRSVLLYNITKLDEILNQLEQQDIFNHVEFRKIRGKIASQQEWGEKLGVSQATIGNYERNVTYPNAGTRRAFVDAIKYFREMEVAKLNRHENISVDVDPIEIKRKLDNSILDAALTDFRYDSDEQRVVPVPFFSDLLKSEIEQVEQDKRDLLESLSQQAEAISSSLRNGANANISRIVSALEGYGKEASSDRANPRKLFRWGSNIARAAASDDLIYGISEWDKNALDGFVADHSDLMKLHFREALAKAQEVDAASVPDDAPLPEETEFQEIARIIDDARDKDGQRLFDRDISTLLRDIARDVQEEREAEVLTGDPERKRAFRRRRVEAVKNGSILVARFLFFASFFVVVDPLVALSTAGSIASVLGLIQRSESTSIKARYDRLRGALPFLPPLPSAK